MSVGKSASTKKKDEVSAKTKFTAAAKKQGQAAAMQPGPIVGPDSGRGSGGKTDIGR